MFKLCLQLTFQWSLQISTELINNWSNSLKYNAEYNFVNIYLFIADI